jgi:hypothetical protein
MKCSEIKACFIYVQSNLRLLEYICCIIEKDFENSQQRPQNSSGRVGRNCFPEVFSTQKPLSYGSAGERSGE